MSIFNFSYVDCSSVPSRSKNDEILMDCYQFIDIDSESGVGRSSLPEKSDFDRNLLGVLVQPPVEGV